MDISSDLWRHFAGALLVISITFTYCRIGRAGAFWQILCRLPGTVLHEAAHVIVGAFTGGRPTGFSIIPRRRPGNTRSEWVLGSVTLRNPGALSALPTGLAPLLLLVVAWYACRHWFAWFPRNLPSTLCLYGAVCILCCGSVPSAQDLRVAFSSLAGVALYSALGAAVVILLG